jgi:integrase
MSAAKKIDSYQAVSRTDGSTVPYLFKRLGGFYSLIPVNGKNVRRRCPHRTAGKAEAWVNELRGKLLNLEPSVRMRSEWPTVKDLCDAYMTAVPARYAVKKKPSLKTARTNCWMFRRMVADLHGVENPDQMRIGPDLLTDQSTSRFMELRLKPVGLTDALLETRARVSAASLLTQARSLFAKWTKPYYREAGLRLPEEVWQWVDSVESTKPEKYKRPAEELVAATMAGILGQPPAIRAAFALVYNLGMRRDEALHARWDWVVPYNEARGVAIPLQDDYGWRGAKNKKDRVVPAVAEVWAELEAVRSGEYLLPGATEKERVAHLDNLALWLRSIGWDRRRRPHPLHEMRKLAGSKWCRSSGVQAAAKWLGDTIPVVLHFYVDDIETYAPVKM